jgi:hypothetical protein
MPPVIAKIAQTIGEYVIFRMFFPVYKIEGMRMLMSRNQRHSFVTLVRL